MPRDRDNRPRNEAESSEQPVHANVQDNERESSYVKNANASGTGSLGRSEENNIEDENDSEERIY